MPYVSRDYRLLIVDDDDIDQRHYRNLLTRRAPSVFEIGQAYDGAAGLVELRTQKYDCVLLDYKLPDMTGLEFLTNAAIEGKLPCAFVLVTGQGSEKIAVEAMKCGVDDYIVKDQIEQGRLWHAITRAVAQTELRQRLAGAQHDLQHREALLRSILATVPDALVVIDREGAIQSFSAAAEHQFGFGSEEVRGISIGTLMPSPHWANISTGERDSVGIGAVVAGQRKDGSTFPIEIAIGEVYLSGAQLFTVFVRDLTKQQDRERRLNELQAELVHTSRLTELGQMVLALAHEVTQPLTAMASYLSAARRLLTAGDQQGAQRAIERIAEQGDRARQIIRNLRDHARKREMEKRPECVLTIIEEASALARLGAAESLSLTIRVDGDATVAIVDRIQIQQVLLNLIRNAAEAMAGSAQRELSITAARVADMVEISVADSGPGLPESVRARLFQPFVTTKRDGMGVGLSVCRTIVEVHGGELRAEDGVGGGTVFRLTVPRETAPGEPIAYRSSEVFNASQSKTPSHELAGCTRDNVSCQ
jgi:two-component system sensor kinase FixL